MNISNFSFLNEAYPKLAKLGKQAEGYVHSDPQTVLFKLRLFSEVLVEYIYSHLQLEDESNDDLFTRLNNREFRIAVDTSIQSKLHTIRKYGNKAVHNQVIFSTDDALWLTNECYMIGRWFIQTMQTSYVFVPEYVVPNPIVNQTNKLKADNEELKTEVDSHTSALADAKSELEVLREELNQTKSAQETAEAIAAKLKEFKNASEDAANSFDLNMDETRRRVKMGDFFSDFELTNGQQKAINMINVFLASESSAGFVLHGYAGTGKTFITKGIVDYLIATGRHCVLMAPTGKAAKVISEKTKHDASTIHREIFDFSDAFDDTADDYSVPIAKVKKNSDTLDTVYIIDESSMLSDRFSDTDSIQFGSGHLLSDLLSYVNDSMAKHNRQIIFIGDNAQLPPVGMNYSPALNEEYLLEEHKLGVSSITLDEVVRQKADSGVMDNATTLRDSLKIEEFNQLDFKIEKTDVISIQSDDVVPKYVGLCNKEIAQTKEVVIIASSNKQVRTYNYQVREYFFPNQSELCVGDKIISVANHYRDHIAVTNGEFGMIRQILSGSEVKNIFFKKKLKTGKTESVSVQLTFKDVEIAFRNDTGQVVCFKTKVIENLIYNDEPGLTADESRALYVDFTNRHPELTKKWLKKELKEALLKDPYFNAFKIKYGYAITCHKAQGSEWQHVLVKCSTHYKTLTKDYFRWLYTAITRTSLNLYVIDEPKIKLGGNMTIVGGDALYQRDNVAVPTVCESEQLENDFGIDDSQPHLLNLLKKVTSLTSKHDIQILDVRHHLYQELYVFQKNDLVAEVQFIYNGKKRISTVKSRGLGVLDTELEQLLSPLVGVTLSAVIQTVVAKKEVPQCKPEMIFTFEQEHLEQFHQRVLSILTPHNIIVSELEQQSQWNQRYTFSRETQSAVIDFYYNGKNQFTKVNPMPSLTNSPLLLSEIIQIWSAS